MQKIYQSIGGAPGAGGIPNLGDAGTHGSGPQSGSKGTVSGRAEDVE